MLNIILAIISIMILMVLLIVIYIMSVLQSDKNFTNEARRIYFTLIGFAFVFAIAAYKLIKSEIKSN